MESIVFLALLLSGILWDGGSDDIGARGLPLFLFSPESCCHHGGLHPVVKEVQYMLVFGPALKILRIFFPAGKCAADICIPHPADNY